MAQYVGSRFGQDAPSRIAVATEALLEASELPPGEMTYQALIPFYPPQIASGSQLAGGFAGISSGSEKDDWKAYPGRLDLFFYVGDDVQVPLYFVNPSDPELDMSDENGWLWRSQIRIVHDYRSTLINEFAIAIDYVPADPEVEGDTGKTKLTMFLSRYQNTVIGDYNWDLRSVSPFDGPVYDPPPGWEEPDPDNPVWPPQDEVKTWLYGTLHIVRRVTATDVLGGTTKIIGSPADGTAVVMTPAGWTVGPNGRVP